jgi:hypothetical protein
MTMLAESTTIIAPVIDPDEPTTPVELGMPSVSGLAGPHRTAGASPLRTTDLVDVDGYRLVSRLGAGGMADPKPASENFG